MGRRRLVVVVIVVWLSGTVRVLDGGVAGRRGLIEVMVAECNDEAQGKRRKRKPCPHPDPCPKPPHLAHARLAAASRRSVML